MTKKQAAFSRGPTRCATKIAWRPSVPRYFFRFFGRLCFDEQRLHRVSCGLSLHPHLEQRRFFNCITKLVRGRSPMATILAERRSE